VLIFKRLRPSERQWKPPPAAKPLLRYMPPADSTSQTNKVSEKSKSQKIIQLSSIYR
jgi:hypothetical protein